jgi:nicotinate phosphoribosyltransferase
VTYRFTNRTAELKLNRKAHNWLREQVDKLANLRVTDIEIKYLTQHCDYLSKEYLDYLRHFSLRPDQQVELSFSTTTPTTTESDADEGDITLFIKGRWLETILYEIPLLALISEAYFKFCDTDWDHEGQLDKAYEKGLRLLEAGCSFSEFGSRRRRDYKTHDLVMQGLQQAKDEAIKRSFPGKWAGTSNVHMAMKHNVSPVGTVAHEWFMGIAAITNDYSKANETALQYWSGTFGRGVLSIALTDTFGTPDFLKAFKRPAPPGHSRDPSLGKPNPSFAEVYTGTRQDSGDPYEFIKRMRNFYDEQHITVPKTIVFSDSLNVDRCIEYMHATQAARLVPSFGVGTFFTNDFDKKSSGEKSVPLNIVIKLFEADGRPCIKISDNLGKNMGDSELVAKVKHELGYVEKNWEGGDETKRWGTAEETTTTAI